MRGQMPDAPIRANPSIRKIDDQAREALAFKRAFPLLKPIFRLLGVDVKKLEEALSRIDGLVARTEELASLPDRFNELFSERGWVVYEGINFEAARAAVLKAEAGDLDGAELVLVDHWTPEIVRWGVKSMHAVDAFLPRMELAEIALVDYEAERYHACVPVVLALLDGMVNDVYQKAHGTRRGISAQEADLRAWDSVAGHSTGLNRVLDLVRKGRKRTSSDPITIPYRHGIMHGIDLGYANKMVAAKTWALLFAVGEWAIKAERGLLEEKVEPPPERKSLWLILKEARESRHANEEMLGRIRSWKARTLSIPQDMPASGVPEDFEAGTPEQKLVEYFDLWKRKNYGWMAKCADPCALEQDNLAPREVCDVFSSRKLQSFSISEIRDTAPALSEIDVTVTFEVNGEIVTSEIVVEMSYRGPDEWLATRTDPGEWRVSNWRLDQLGG
jgi:hypothetical protein